MSPISDIVKFAILQVAMICSILLLLDIVALVDFIPFHEPDFSKTLTILAITRGSEMTSVAVFYSLLSGAFHHKFGKLQVWAKEVTSLTVMVTVSAMHHTFYEPLDFKFVLSGMQVVDSVILFSGVYLCIRVPFSILERKNIRRPPGET